MKAFGEFVFYSILLFSGMAQAIILTPKLENGKQVSQDTNYYMDPKVDYTRFGGRLTDRDDSGHILKIHVENNNTKFFKAGDLLRFKVNNQDLGEYCEGSVRSVEDFYFTIFVTDFSKCWRKEQYFPRGLQLNFVTRKLEQRVFEASKYRELLILRKESFLKQLNDINQFLWTYDQARLKAAADFDKQINELKRAKQVALDNLIQKKQENILLQSELIKKLDIIDQDLKHYKVERQEYLTDRWAMDQDQGLPVLRRPQEMKNR